MGPYIESAKPATDGLLTEERTGAPTPSPQPTGVTPPPTRRHSRRWVLVLASVLVIASIGIGALISRNGSDRNEPAADSSVATFDGFGVHFEYPGSWIEMGTNVTDPGISFGPVSTRQDEWIAVNVLSDQRLVDTGNLQDMARASGDLFGEITNYGENGRLMTASQIGVAGLRGTEGTVQGATGPHGQQLDGKLLVLFDGKTWYLLVCQYEPASETMMLPIWHQFLRSMQIDT